MSSEVSFHFPNANTIKAHLSNYPLVDPEYDRGKGIIQAVAELAAARFADRKKVAMGVKLATMGIIEDLRMGVDGFTGKPLPNLGRLGVSPTVWAQISKATEIALLECADKKA